jgi:hypothetical protein
MPEPPGILVDAGRPAHLSLAEPSPNENDSNLWEVRLDPRTGKLEDKPARITNWVGFSFAFPTKLNFQSNVYVAELQAGSTEFNPVHPLTAI